MNGKKFIPFVIVGFIALLCGILFLVSSCDHQTKIQFIKNCTEVQQQAMLTQNAVENWAADNSGHGYPKSLADLNTLGQSVIDYLPEHHMFRNAHYNDGLFVFSEPRNWKDTGDDNQLGAIYYCPKSSGHGYFIRAFTGITKSPIILTNRR